MAQIPDEHVATNFYFDRNFDSEAVKLLPGEYFVTNKDMMLVTVLGSCVAACIRDHRSGIAGCNATYYVGAIFNHLRGMKTAFVACKALYYYTRMFVY